MRFVLMVVLMTIAYAPRAPISQLQPNYPATILVTITAYTSMKELTDDDPWVTASGTRPRIESGTHTMAVSRDLLATVPYGTMVKVSCKGRHFYGLVEDTMNKRWKRRVDIWFPTFEQAVRFGVCKGILEVIDARLFEIR